MVYFLCKASDSGRQNCCFALSLPVRGAWVEINVRFLLRTCSSSLPVRGAWVEMFGYWKKLTMRLRRSPCGERGLKFRQADQQTSDENVAPRAGSVG